MSYDKKAVKEFNKKVKNSHGGARKKAGRKPIEDKKVQVDLYIRQSDIDKRGGIEKIKELLMKGFKD